MTPRECHASTMLYLAPCKCTSALYTRFRATALNTVTSQVRLILVSLHTHSHGENMTVLIYTAESTGAAMERSKMPNLQNGSKGGFEPGLT